MERQTQREGWRSAWEESGAPSAMITGHRKILMSCVEN